MKNSIKTLTILMVMFLFSNVSYGVNYTLNNNTWSPSTPTQSSLSSSDSVIIRGNGTWTLTQAVTLAGVRISGGTFAQSIFNLTGGVSVKGTAAISGAGSISGAVTIASGTLTVSGAKSAGSWVMSGGNLTNSADITGAISVTATGTLAGTSSVGAVTITGGTLTVSAAKTATSWTMNGGNLTNSANILGAISVTATGTLAGTSSVGAVTVTSGTLTVSADKTASSVTLNGGSLNIGANNLTTTLSVSANATLTTATGGDIVGAVTVSGGTLTCSSSNTTFTSLTLSGGSISSGSRNITTPVTVSANGTITATGTYGAVTVTAGTLSIVGNMTYSSLTLNGGSANIGSYDPTGSVSVSQSATLTVASGGTIDALTISSGTLTIAGSNLGNTSLAMSGGTLSLGSFILTGSSNISITGNATITSSGSGYINNQQTLTINGGSLTLDNAELIIDNITFSSGHDVITTNGGILSFNNSQSHSAGSGAADRHVVGKIRVYLDNSSTNSNTYPLGDGSTYAPIFLQANGKDSSGANLSNPSGGFGTHYIDMVYTGSKNSNTAVDNTLPGNASGEEYWSVTRSSTKPAANLTFRFSTTNTGTTYSKTRISGTLDTAKLRTDIKVASFNFSTNKWTALTTVYSIVPANNYIAITTSTITPNTSFTIGSNNIRSSFVTPLPVSIIDFSAKANNASIDVKWSTASEKDNSAFVLEKSLDGQTWSAIGTVKGAKTSNVVNNYGLVDYKAVAGFQYYRLKQIDLDGTVNYSKAIAVNFSKTSTLNVNLFPNPAKDALNITTENNATGEVNIQILNSMGETVYNQVVEAGLVQSIDMTSFIPGVYYVTVIAEGESKIIRLLKN